ncbi:hypothetical protein DFH08DRAFT_821649 [Mycena albidolilacea]|uniref:Uncharacterized protein n=1 Tax=Mycena albidolilacea TaxID=1033008 RepID=A0AAD6ZAL1_9AGAR|nr:hypothetical protein DFH08DRAFT_821649 [Mycena albidolilacea]
MASHPPLHDDAAALAFLRARRPIVHPNSGFLAQLALYGRCGCDLDANPTAVEAWRAGARRMRTWRVDWVKREDSAAEAKAGKIRRRKEELFWGAGWARPECGKNGSNCAIELTATCAANAVWKDYPFREGRSGHCSSVWPVHTCRRSREIVRWGAVESENIHSDIHRYKSPRYHDLTGVTPPSAGAASIVVWKLRIDASGGQVT